MNKARLCFTIEWVVDVANVVADDDIQFIHRLGGKSGRHIVQQKQAFNAAKYLIKRGDLI